MIKICKQNNESVLSKIRNGKLDSISLSQTNLVDDIILAMHNNGILSHIKDNITDKRADNTVIPFDLVWALSIAAKMKVKTSLSDIPYAITDHRALGKLGYTLIGDLNNGLMQEGSLRFLIGKYTSEELFNDYNKIVQSLNLEATIHILDCTDLEVNLNNSNYEGSGIYKSKRDSKLTRGYKLSTLRGIIGDTGIIEDIRFGAINIHDLKLSEEMLKTSPVLKPHDILINDRGFLSRELINYLKKERNVDTYIPLKKNMEAYKLAVLDAKMLNKWKPHPNKKRENQCISFVEDLGEHWFTDNPKDDVPINGCVVWDKETDDYFVFVTTDITKSAKQIIQTYELRPEIEEDYRQLKDFWKLEDFKSTKLNVIAFHIVCVLLGYLFFQLYTTIPEGEKYLGKCLPVILRNYIPEIQPYVVLYVGYEFGVLTLFEVLELYADCNEDTRSMFKKVLEDEKK